MGKPNSLQLFVLAALSAYRSVPLLGIGKGMQSIWNIQAFPLHLWVRLSDESIAHYTSFRSVGFRTSRKGRASALFNCITKPKKQ